MTRIPQFLAACTLVTTFRVVGKSRMWRGEGHSGRSRWALQLGQTCLRGRRGVEVPSTPPKTLSTPPPPPVAHWHSGPPGRRRAASRRTATGRAHWQCHWQWQCALAQCQAECHYCQWQCQCGARGTAVPVQCGSGPECQWAHTKLNSRNGGCGRWCSGRAGKREMRKAGDG